jgi:hypothetical protein
MAWAGALTWAIGRTAPVDGLAWKSPTRAQPPDTRTRPQRAGTCQETSGRRRVFSMGGTISVTKDRLAAREACRRAVSVPTHATADHDCAYETLRSLSRTL